MLVHAVGLAVTTSPDRYPTYFKVGSNFRNCECFLPCYSSEACLIEFLGEIFITLISSTDREIQAGGFEGPIPPSLSALNTITEL